MNINFMCGNNSGFTYAVECLKKDLESIAKSPRAEKPYYQLKHEIFSFFEENPENLFYDYRDVAEAINGEPEKVRDILNKFASRKFFINKGREYKMRPKSEHAIRY